LLCFSKEKKTERESEKDGEKEKELVDCFTYFKQLQLIDY